MMITWTRGLCFRRQLPCAHCSWDPPGQCPVIVSALMSGELGVQGVRACSRVQSLSCNLLTSAQAQVHKTGGRRGLRREVWSKVMKESDGLLGASIPAKHGLGSHTWSAPF